MTKSSLSTSQRRLLEAMQKSPYGRIECLTVHAGQPIFDPPPRMIRDVKLGAADNGPRIELDSIDFELKQAHRDLFEQLGRLGDGIVECIEVKGGLPFRIIFKHEI